MDNPFDAFDSVYCINLDSRPDRWAAAWEQFRDVGIEERVVRFAGIVPEGGPTGEGCARSHLEIVRMARDAGHGNVLVLEDDVSFARDARNTLRQTLEQPRSVRWDVLYLGATALKPLRNVSANVVRIQHCYASHALCYNASIFEYVLSDLKPAEHLIDVWLRRQVQVNFRCYGAYPLVATQTPGFSNILGHDVEYSFMQARYRTRQTRQTTPFPDAAGDAPNAARTPHT